jgi:hypothetical protein
MLLIGYIDEPTSVTTPCSGSVLSFVRCCCDSVPRAHPSPPRGCDSFVFAHSPPRPAVDDCSRTSVNLPSLTNSGKCYEPGEFCRNSDHGVSGVAGNGEKIRCEDNNGWRWEPV